MGGCSPQLIMKVQNVTRSLLVTIAKQGERIGDESIEEVDEA
jgi:hypothetical protein